MWYKIKDFFNKNEDIIEEENEQLRKKHKYSLKEINSITKEKDELSKKYIDLLEEKTKGFDKYLEYKTLYEQNYEIVKSQKKEIAVLKEDIKRLEEENNALQEKINKKNKTIKKCNKKVEELKKEDIENGKAK